MRLALCLLIAVSAYAESAAGVQWTAPQGWTSSGATQMRAATYEVDDKTECVVYFFGQGQGGSVEANLARWKGQFTVNSKPADAKTEKRTIHGLTVTTIDVSGTYGATGGAAMNAPTTAQPDFRMLSAVVEGPGGNLFIRLVGPAKTVAANRAKYEKLLTSFGKQ